MTHIFKDKSMCCKAEVIPSRTNPRRGDTVYSICTSCNKPCNVYEEHSEGEDRDINVPIKTEEEKVGWEESFDKRFEGLVDDLPGNSWEYLHDFIRNLLATATKEAEKRGYEKGYLVGLVDGHTDHKDCFNRPAGGGA